MPFPSQRPERKRRKIEHVVDAIEAFVSARINYERRLTTDPEWASYCDIYEMREHLIEKLEELLS